MILLPEKIALILLLFVSLVFLIVSLRKRQGDLMPKLFCLVSVFAAGWAGTVLLMSRADLSNSALLWCLDAVTNVFAVFMPPLFLMIAFTFIKGWKKLPHRMRGFFIVPVISSLVIWTNPLHHLQYVHFSVLRSEIIFGPYIFVTGAYSYLCNLIALIALIRFVLKNSSSLYRKQVLMLSVGVLIPTVVSMLSTLGVGNFSIAATPIAFGGTMCCSIIAVYWLHITDITPIATQHLLNRVSDGYLVVNEKGLIVNFNLPMQNILGDKFNVRDNIYLKDCIRDVNRDDNTIIYDFMSYIETCRRDRTTVSYELTFVSDVTEDYRKYYYFVEVIPLIVEELYTGAIIILKDITQVKNSMEQVQENKNRMMEQERLAFIGQLTGGLAHNLKTPIMSISGCSVALERLVQESLDSLGDPEVLGEDYREIFGEMTDWIMKIRESCSYMSDIITAVKGQTTNAKGTEGTSFTVSKLMKRASLLMQHEAKLNHCVLNISQEENVDYILDGDINCLVQVMNNLVSNAIDAQKKQGGGGIDLCVERSADGLNLFVKDSGTGISPEVMEKLFKEMTTSKGTKGTGLGLYISNSLIRSAFGGYMWAKNNEDCGASIGMTIPMKVVTELDFRGEV